MQLRKYQTRGVEHLDKHRHALMLLPMGAGKTAICCRWMDEWDMRVLVVAPLRVAETVWPVELEKWAPELTCRVVTGAKAKRTKALAKDADVTVVNYDNLVWFLENTDLDYDTIVFDELTAMKNPSAKRFKAFMKKRKYFETIVGLTGTFTAKGVKDLYAQMKCIDGGARLGKTLTVFRGMYLLQGYNDWDWQPRAGALRNIMKKVSSIAYTVTDEEYLAQLPPLVTNEIVVDLPEPARDMYEELRREYIAKFGSDIVWTPNAGALNNKLQQLANGLVYGEGQKTIEVHTAKLDALEEVIASQQGQPTLVVYRYRHELAAMKKRCPGIDMGENHSSFIVRKWNAGELDTLYIHPASAGHGLNLQEGGNTVVWFGHTWSWEEYEQVIARLLRSGQKTQVFNHLILARDTIDDNILARRAEEADYADEMMTGLKERQA